MKKRMFILTAVALALVSATAMATPSMTAMPFEGTGTSSYVSAVTPDGKYAIGPSNGKGCFWDISANTTTAIVASGAWAFTSGNGIDYRKVGGNKQLVAAGLSSGWASSAYSTDNGATWITAVRDSAAALNAANALRAVGGASDAWYMTSQSDTGSSPTLYVEKVSGATPTLVSRDTKGTTQKSQIHMVSATGLAVGNRRGDGSNEWNYKLQYGGAGGLAASYFTGLAGDNRGQAWSISADGDKIFGMGPVLGGRTGNWPYMRDDSDATIVELPTQAGTAGSTTNAIPYGCSLDGNIAVGMNYLGAERAVLWYKSYSGWRIMDLTNYASTHGLLGPFTGNLRRAYSIGVDPLTKEVVVTGLGVNSLLQTQGFALRFYLPEPATLAFLSLGGLALLRRRH
jgi:hypothetical protein